MSHVSHRCKIQTVNLNFFLLKTMITRLNFTHHVTFWYSKNFNAIVCAEIYVSCLHRSPANNACPSSFQLTGTSILQILLVWYLAGNYDLWALLRVLSQRTPKRNNFSIKEVKRQNQFKISCQKFHPRRCGSGTATLTDLATSHKRTNNNSVYSKYPQKFIYTHSWFIPLTFLTNSWFRSDERSRYVMTCCDNVVTKTVRKR